MHKKIISPSSQSIFNAFIEVWEYRELLWILAWRDFRVRYAQSFLGILWAFINPIATLLILSFVFGTVAKISTNGVPHLLYTTAGMCGWTFFASLTSDTGRSIIGAQNMIKKIYFPRLVIPLSKVFTSLIDFVIVLFCLFCLMVWYQYPIANTIIWFPFFLIVAILAGVSIGVGIAGLTIRFRDFLHTVPLFLRLGLYATPIAYPASAVPEQYQLIFFLNPMAGVVEGIRWSILGVGDFPDYIWLSFSMLLFILIMSFMYFNKIEKEIADII